MIKSYIKIAIRNLLKQKGYALINVLGLAVGLASCVIILFYVLHETSYDRHHENADRVYRVVSQIDFSGNYLELASVSAPMGPTLEEMAPEVEAMVRFRPRGSYLVRSEQSPENINEDRLVYAGPQVFRVFTMPLIHGEAESALRNPHSIVISRSAAERHFNRTDVVGESLILDNNSAFEITGVMEDIPVTSHFHFDFMMSMSTIDEADNNTWLSNNFRTYLLLADGTDPEAMEHHFNTLLNTHIEPQLQQFMGMSLEEFRAAGNSVEYGMQPLTDIHLHSDLAGEFEANGSITYVYIFSALAVFILMLACINFMNLATARSAQRAREVGVRKTLGSSRKQLAWQFLAESVLMSGLAFLVALLMVEISLPFFSELAGRPITSQYLAGPWLLPGIIAVVVLTGLVAGSYPALMLSSFQPVRVLKGSFTERGFQGVLRKGLVVFQFTMSIVIVIGLLVINRQLEYVQSKSLGFDRDQVVVIHDAYAIGGVSEIQTFKQSVMDYPVFRSGTISSFYPVEGFGRNDMVFWPKGASPSSDNTVSMQQWRVGDDYLETMGMELVEGRNLSGELDSGQNRVILNESAVARFGFEDPLGEEISVYGGGNDGSINSDTLIHYTVVGVVRDFHYESLRETILPLGLFYQATRGNVAFRINESSASEALDYLEQEWQKAAAGQPFSYSFLDQRFDQMYRSESRAQNLMTAFSILALVIACMGLFGLSAYTAEKRTREIGIRKVMGAGTGSIVTLVSGEFLKLVLISFLLAVPISWLIMQQWLSGFAYKTGIGWSLFLLAGAGAVVVALATVSWQSVRAALKNPVDSLRTE